MEVAANRAPDRRDRRQLGGWAALALLLLGAAIIRFYHLGSNPPGFWQDEASTGADAFSLWTTGRDRAGARWPVICRSFGDYPLALYRYLDAPIVGLLGMSPANERAVAAIGGTLLVAVSGALAAQLLGTRAGVAALLITALCPTLLVFSRYGSEAILLPLTLISGWWLIELGREPRRRELLWLGTLTLAASAYSYHAVKIFLPVWMIGFAAYLWPLIRELWSRRERAQVLGPLLLFLLLVAPSVQAALTPEGMSRGKVVMAWNHHHGWALLKTIGDNYLSYLDWQVLFLRGGSSPAQSYYGLGLLSWIEAPLLMVGLVRCAMPNPGPSARALRFMLFWFLIGPLPGALSYEGANVGRVIGWFPAPQLIAAAGALTLYELAEQRGRRLAIGAQLIFGLATFATAEQLIVHGLVRYPQLAKVHWQYEISTALLCARALAKHEKIVISPAFTFAELWAYYYFREQGSDANPVYVLEDRNVVAPGEIYIFPAEHPLPKGRELCAITEYPGAAARSYVYGAAPAAAPPVAPGAPGAPVAPGK